MNKILTALLTAFALQASAQQAPPPEQAAVNQIEGYYIFVDSRPVRKYQYLGTVKSNTGGFGSAQYTDVRDRLINRAKKQYPKADGLIFHFVSGKADEAEAIMFEN